MKKVLVFILAFIIPFTVFAITQDYEWNELVLFTYLWGITFNAVLWLIASIVLQRKYNKTNQEIKLTEHLLMQCKADLESVELVADNQAKEIDNYTKMFEQQKKKDNATIKLGDKVTPTNRMQIKQVKEMRLHVTDKDGNGRDIVSKQYRLSATGKWFRNEEIRKVDN